jgi:nucleoside-diphosphate-sugar epimerase
MSRVVVIGASGHVGTYLVPRLVEAGHDVIAISRGNRQPYHHHAAWRSVRSVVMDRAECERAGSFGASIRGYDADIVIDMICFTLDSARQIVEALKGRVQHFFHTGTIWVHGPSAVVPTTEAQPRRPFGDYGTQKAAIEEYLLRESSLSGFPATIVHPGHIVGPGWNPLGPAGHFDPVSFSLLAQGGELALPHFGLETVHHVHADDVAQLFMRAIANRSAAVGEAFHAVSPAALSLRGYAHAMAAWFGRPANLAFLPWDDWKAHHTQEQTKQTWEHISRSPNCSIEKARRLLAFEPRFSSLQAIQESVAWMVQSGIVATTT